MTNFALIGAAGFVAPRHMQAIMKTGGKLTVAMDTHDSVGVLDSYFPDAAFFTEFERFDRHVEKLRRGPVQEHINYVSICSPNYLHDAHIRFALRVHADAICEKPLVLEPWNVDALEELEKESGQRINAILQLRLHPAIMALRNSVLLGGDKVYDVDLRYVTSRGRWYASSWKGQAEKSGGVVMNIGVHFFDMLLWIFGGVVKNTVQVLEATKASGYLELERARVRWFLSIDARDLPLESGCASYRSLTVDGRTIEFSGGFADLHTRSYELILAGKGFSIANIKPSIQLVHDIGRAAKTGAEMSSSSYFKHESSYVDEGAAVGQGTKIWHFSHVMPGAKIGKRCVLGQNVNVAGGVVIGDNVKVQNNVSIYTGVTIEDDVFLGPSCVMTNVRNPRSEVDRHDSFEKTIIRRGATIGANATIVCGVTIGKYAFVGAGAVVTKDVPDYGLVIGVPARRVGWMGEQGIKN